MYIQIFAVILHALLLLLLIKVFNMDVIGAAIATFLSNLFIFTVNAYKTRSYDDL